MKWRNEDASSGVTIAGGIGVTAKTVRYHIERRRARGGFMAGSRHRRRACVKNLLRRGESDTFGGEKRRQARHAGGRGGRKITGIEKSATNEGKPKICRKMK